jgi:hypothetical protein
LRWRLDLPGLESDDVVIDMFHLPQMATTGSTFGEADHDTISRADRVRLPVVTGRQLKVRHDSPPVSPTS